MPTPRSSHAVELRAVTIAAHDVDAVAGFWSAVLGWPIEPAPSGAQRLVPSAGTDIPLLVEPEPLPKPPQNTIHFDLTSADPADMEATIDRALSRGGRLLDIGQGADEDHEVLADPEGNELCVIEPGNAFLAGTGVIGAINCDGTREVGLFWSAALGWPLVWDQEEETAIQSPAGGPKVTWSGPPLLERPGRSRLRFDLTATTTERAVEGLLSLGAARGVAGDDVGAVAPQGSPSEVAVLRDPDGNEFRIRPRP